MVAKKRKQIHHNYDEIHIRFILAELINNTPYKKIQTKFNDNFGWKIPLGTITKIKSDELNKVKQQSENNSKGNGGIVPRTERQLNKAINTNQIREDFVNRILPIINMDVDANGDPLTPIDKMSLIKELAQPLLKALDGIDSANKISATFNQTNIYAGSTEDMDDDQLKEQFQRFREVFCARCPMMKDERRVIDV